jgi:hypothetical protein
VADTAKEEKSMIRQRTGRVLKFLSTSVHKRGDDISQARRFAEKLSDLNDLEQLLLGCALQSRKDLEQFSTIFKA